MNLKSQFDPPGIVSVVAVGGNVTEASVSLLAGRGGIVTEASVSLLAGRGGIVTEASVSLLAGRGGKVASRRSDCKFCPDFFY